MTAIALAAVGEQWETVALGQIDSSTDLHLTRRCVDIPDLVSAGATEGADFALITLALPGLDADTVYRLDQGGVHTIAVVEPAHEQAAQALGIESTIGPGQLRELESYVTNLSVPDKPPPRRHRSSPTGQLIAVWGPAGAPGRSTTALCMASQFAARSTSTMLIDADPYGGSLAQLLGVLDEVSGVLAATRAANIGAMDTLTEYAYAVGDDLMLLSGLPRASLWPQVRSGAYEVLLGRARSEFEVSVADCGFCLESAESFDVGAPRRNQVTLQTLEAADQIVVVGTADPVGLTRLARGIHELRDVVPGAQIKVVVNRHRTDPGWSRDQISDTLVRLADVEPAAFLPADQRGLDRAVMAGQSLVELAPDSPVARGVAKLVDQLDVAHAVAR